MKKPKLSPGLVAALAILSVVGIFANGSHILQTAGVVPSNPTARPLSEEQLYHQREEMTRARPARAATGSEISTPTLLIEPEQGNVKQNLNPSQPESGWHRKGSYAYERGRQLREERGQPRR